MTDKDWEGIRWFARKEFECNCGCGVSNPQKKMVERLDRARDRAGIPFPIQSGSRCAEYNSSPGVGGVDSSAHLAENDNGLVSYAADITVYGSRNRYKIQEALLSVGFTRFGIGDRFIHVDIDPTKDPEVTWLY